MKINQQPAKSVKVQIGLETYQTIVSSGKHSIIVDEPEDIGEDTGMDPQSLLLASLGSCTAITLRMYINRKMWRVDQITVNLDLFKIENETVIKIWLSFKGELSTVQTTRLIQIANACPIHKLLSGNIKIETSIV